MAFFHSTGHHEILQQQRCPARGYSHEKMTALIKNFELLLDGDVVYEFLTGFTGSTQPLTGFSVFRSSFACLHTIGSLELSKTWTQRRRTTSVKAGI